MGRNLDKRSCEIIATICLGVIGLADKMPGMKRRLMSHDEGLTPSPTMGGARSYGRLGRTTGVASVGVVIEASSMRREPVGMYLFRVVFSGRDCKRLMIGSSRASTPRSLPHILTLVLEPDLNAARAHVQTFGQLGTLFSRRECCSLPHLIQDLQLIRIGSPALLLDSRLLRALGSLWMFVADVCR